MPVSLAPPPSPISCSAVQESGLAFGAVGGVHAEEPAQALDALTLLGAEFAPLFLAHLIDRFGEAPW